MDYGRFTAKFQVWETCDQAFFFSRSFLSYLSFVLFFFWGGGGWGWGERLENAKAKEKGKKDRLIAGSRTIHKQLANLS